MRDPGPPPRLVVPEGLMIDEHVRERLERRLLAAPQSVVGIAAPIAELESGASYRVHTEWLSLTAGPPHPAASTTTRGAVLLRPDVEFSVDDGAVTVERGSVIVDPGAPVHDPHRRIGPLQPASERGRPPFPRRPVTVFLGCQPNVHADWLRRLVNRLVRHDVEARIATPAPLDGPSPGPHLTRPCLPGEATIHTLAPDVIVTLDAEAAAHIDAWCAGDRSTVVVEFDPTLSEPMELVSWQLGRAAGRVRARIGPWVDVAAFASLVGRLCAGPHPIAPSDRDETSAVNVAVREHWTNAQTDAHHRCVVLTGTLDAPAAARIDGLVDNLQAAGVSVLVGRHPAPDPPAGDVARGARDAGLLVVAGVAPDAELDTVLAARGVARLRTAIDLGAHDLDVGRSAASTGPVLTAAAAALSEACEVVMSPAGALRTAAEASGRHCLVVPTLLTRAHAAALRDARTDADPAAVLVIGWPLRAGSGDRPAYFAAVADGIARILTEHGDRIEIAGDVDDVPAGLVGHDRLTVLPDAALDAQTIARWALQVWTPTFLAGEIVDDARRFEEASCAGVPSVMPAAAGAAVDGFVSPHVLVQSVDRADDWYDALHHVLDDVGRRTRRAHEAARRADALDGPAASKAVVSRIMGLARYRVGPVT
jgi:hypothetical protein